MSDLPAPVVDAINKYRPHTRMPEHRWAHCATQVRAAVTAAQPLTAHHARVLASDTVRFLNNGLSGWDGASSPDLTALMTVDALTRVAASLPQSGRPAFLAQTRRVGRALGAVPGARPTLRTWESPNEELMRAVGAPVPVVAILRGWETHTGLKLPVYTLRVVGRATLKAADADQGPAPSALLTLSEASGVPREVIVASRGASRSGRTTKPMSRRAANAAAKKALAAQQARAVGNAIPVLQSLPEEITAHVEAFRPLIPVRRRVWQANLDVAQRLVLGYRPTSKKNASSVCSYVAEFLTWVAYRPRPHAPGSPVTLEELRAPGLVEDFVAASSKPDRSRASMRSTITRSLASLGPAAETVQLSGRTAKAPYSTDECDLLVRVAGNQPTQLGTMKLSFLVGLGLGAGLKAGELARLTRSSFSDVKVNDAPPVLVVRIDGKLSRSVPIRRPYEDLVRSALTIHAQLGKQPGDLLIGAKPDRTNVTSSVVSKVRTADEADLWVNLPRMRSTWLVDLMCSPVPMVDVLKAAGLVTGRTLAELLPFCPEPCPQDVQAVTARLANGQDGES